MGRRKTTEKTPEKNKGKKANVAIPQSEALTIPFSEPWKARLQQQIIAQRTNPRRVSLAAGLNPTTVNQLLKSRRSPGVDTIMAVADALGVTVHWLLTGQDVALVGDVIKADAPKNDQLQRVPVIDWASILDFIDKRDAPVMRYEMAERIDPSVSRFRLEYSGTAMSPIIDDGSILDCSGAIIAEPEDVVIAYIAKTKQCIVRQIAPATYTDDGDIVSGKLISPNPHWPDISFDADRGDRIVAVVVDVIKVLKKVRRPKLQRRAYP